MKGALIYRGAFLFSSRTRAKKHFRSCRTSGADGPRLAPDQQNPFIINTLTLTIAHDTNRLSFLIQRRMMKIK
jgi:hypothetical protein